MTRNLTIGVACVCAVAFGWGVPLARLFNAFQPMTVALSIMVAAVFVRLNRGMPTLDWKSLEIGKRSQLTSGIVEITKEYGWIIAINTALLIVLVTLSVFGVDQVKAGWPAWAQQCVSAGIGFGISLCLCRMAYVVWRDIDIVKLQKHLVDNSAARDFVENEAKTASDKIASIRATHLRSVPAGGEPKAWDN